MGGAFSSAFSSAFNITIVTAGGHGAFWVPTRFQTELEKFLVRKIRRRPSMWKPGKDGVEPVE